MPTASEALSFTSQPAFRGFIEAIASDEPITFICGAGLSVEAGLPTWDKLIEKLAERIKDKELTEVIKAEEPDPKRHAQMVLSARGVALRDVHRIADALYDGPSRSGQLLSSLSNLIALLRHRISIVTTNYDDCLESALLSVDGLTSDDVKPFGLGQIDEWKSYAGVGILHVHGFIPSNSNPQWSSIEPVILTEGQYIQHGSSVQKVVRDQAEETHCVFIGSSLTDENVTYPLSANYSEIPIKDAFALMVPNESHAGHIADRALKLGREVDTEDLVDKYFTLRKEHVYKVYRTQVVGLKSYGQVAQCVQEAVAAIQDVERYFSDDPERSARYGFRFQRIMDAIHGRLKVERGQYAPGWESSLELSSHMHKILTAEDGPSQILDRSFRKGIRAAYRSKSYTDEVFNDERFGLYLWLRTVLPRGEFADYEVFNVGASSYARRDGHAMMQRSPVSWRSVYAAANAVYGGTIIIQSPYPQVRDPNPGSALDRPWRSYLAAPISLSETDLELSSATDTRVTVGAIVLQTSRTIERQIEKSDFEPNHHSIVSILDEKDFGSLVRSVAEAGAKSLLEFTSS